MGATVTLGADVCGIYPTAVNHRPSAVRRVTRRVSRHTGESADSLSQTEHSPHLKVWRFVRLLLGAERTKCIDRPQFGQAGPDVAKSLLCLVYPSIGSMAHLVIKRSIEIQTIV